MPDLVFQVIDLACESADQSFFPPKVTLTTKSTTQIATLLGFSEYPGFESIPPKKYKTLTWNGTSEHQLWWVGPQGIGGIGPVAPEQIAGARIDYSGSSTIDSNGNYLTLYTKNISEMCSAVDSLISTLVPTSSGALTGYKFLGWSGPTVPAGHQKCTPPNIPYVFVSNEAIGKGNAAIQDSSGLWGSHQVSPSALVFRTDFIVNSATNATCTDTGGSQTGFPQFNTSPWEVIALFEPVPEGTVVDIAAHNQGSVWFFATPYWTNNYSADLSNEYTDAEALANAQIITGTSSVAENFPRTTGFISRFTSVIFTLKLSNLIVGSSYVVSVDLADLTSGTTTNKQYGITPTATTHSIVDIIPTPLAGHYLTVRNPKVIFA